MGPGRFAREESRLTGTLFSFSSLQWGPGVLPGKSPGPTGGTTPANQLQWGPGVLPGKSLPTGWSEIVLLELQWGPGVLPGKSNPTWFRSGRSVGFNGARAFCPGRGHPSQAAWGAGFPAAFSRAYSKRALMDEYKYRFSWRDLIYVYCFQSATGFASAARGFRHHRTARNRSARMLAIAISTLFYPSVFVGTNWFN